MASLRSSPVPLRNRPRYAKFFRPGWSAIAVCCAAFSWNAFGAEAALKFFDLPSDSAERTLKSFAAQSGLEVLFLTEVTKNVRTNAVRGELVPKVAIDRMLAGTSLVALESKRTGAFKIQRGPGPNDQRGGQSNGDNPMGKKKIDHPGESSTQMKSKPLKNPLAILGAWLAFTFASPHGAHGADVVAGDQRPSGTITGKVKNIATGQYLNQAKVSIKSTSHIVYTDNFGAFRFLDVPSGPVTLEVFFTDLDPIEIAVDVPVGGIAELSVDLTSVARYGKDASAIKLDPYIVASDRETDAQAIAANEQRFAPNIKNVMATDAHGDVLGNNVGEFLKFMPGISVEYGLSDAIGVSVRGVSSSMVSVTSDGLESSNAWHDSSRGADFRSMSLNDVSRIEVVKVPIPSMPADSMGGSVNFVGKSAFERNGRQFRFGVSLAGLYPYGNFTLNKRPDSYSDEERFKVLPNADFDFSWPISKTFGVVITGMQSNTINDILQSRLTWANVGSGTNASAASLSNPIMGGYFFRAGSRKVQRNTLRLKADWRLTQHSVLSLAHTINRASTENVGFTFTANAGTNGTPTPATGRPLTWGADFTEGATGRGSLNLGNQLLELIDQDTDDSSLRYRFDDGRWQVEARLGRSGSKTLLQDTEHGYFRQVTLVNTNPVRVSFLGIDGHKPETIAVADNNGTPLDWRNLAIYRGNTAAIGPGSLDNVYNTGKVNVRRRFNLLPFPAELELGGYWRERIYDRRRKADTLEFRAPDGVSRLTASVEPYEMKVYNKMEIWGFEGVRLPSPRLFYEAWQSNPLLFARTAAQQYTGATTEILNSEHIEEKVEATYLQGEVSLFDNRLRVVGGVRFEKTSGEGEGALVDPNAVWQRNANGGFVRNAAGARVRRLEAGAVQSLAEVALTHKERAAISHRGYDGYYPSLHLTYNLRENVLIRGAYAKTYGRPDFADIIPRTTINQADLDDDEIGDPSLPQGTLTVRNSGLKPWTADNFDLSVEYYASKASIISGGIFQKELHDFFGSVARIATLEDLEAMGLDPTYVGWNLVSKMNAGEARVQGAEINVQHSLAFLGSWGRHFNVFANATKLKTTGQSSASLGNFVPEMANWGLAFGYRRVSWNLRWNYQGRTGLGPRAEFGPDGYAYNEARTTLDLSAAYQLSRRFSVNLSINNVFNAPRTVLRYGSQTPIHARIYQQDEYGARVGLGLRGTF